jgi:hypothetical protein
MLPPGYKGEVPKGYYVYRSGTNNVFVFLRAFYQDPKNLTPAVELVEQAKIYPLNGKATAKAMVFPDASGVAANMLPISDGSAFDQLKQLVDSEGANLAGSDWLGMLASIGIIKDQPFNPDAHTRQILDQAAKTGYKMSRVINAVETSPVREPSRLRAPTLPDSEVALVAAVDDSNRLRGPQLPGWLVAVRGCIR